MPECLAEGECVIYPYSVWDKRPMKYILKAFVLVQVQMMERQNLVSPIQAWILHRKYHVTIFIMLT